MLFLPLLLFLPLMLFLHHSYFYRNPRAFFPIYIFIFPHSPILYLSLLIPHKLFHQIDRIINAILLNKQIHLTLNLRQLQTSFLRICLIIILNLPIYNTYTCQNSTPFTNYTFLSRAPLQNPLFRILFPSLPSLLPSLLPSSLPSPPHFLTNSSLAFPYNYAIMFTYTNISIFLNTKHLLFTICISLKYDHQPRRYLS